MSWLDAYFRPFLVALLCWVLYYAVWGTRDQVTRAIKIIYYALQMTENLINLHA